MRRLVAVWAGKSSAAVLRRVGGGGTTLPGRIAATIAPQLLGRLLAQTPTVLVAGTNGKTTTTRLISGVLRARGRRVVSNGEGANLFHGIVSTATRAADLRGRVAADEAVLEVDELTLPRVVAQTRPALIVLTNVYRDQLDRYGEVDRVVRAFSEAIAALPRDAVIVANADDPRLVEMVRASGRDAVWFGVAHEETRREPFLVDRRLCASCGEMLAHDASGFHCRSCGFSSPPTRFRATIRRTDVPGLLVEVNGFTIASRLQGDVNAANLAAAFAAVTALGVPEDDAAALLADVEPPYGRYEIVEVEGRRATLVLLKNPVGFNVFLDELVRGREPARVLLAINDLPADGEDLSWMWDVDFERLAERGGLELIVAGRRYEDVVLRLKYAGIEPARASGDLDAAVQRELRRPSELPLIMMCTYTAMMQARARLQNDGLAANYWSR
ncbi:MAG TPA: MurT ligase domain-containing protein [Candidatus Sulfotelmatobacter sp.]|nr:MurT ligase domain-containing protein [Candidatus Sulfotelmatobacter sp.]